MAKRRTKPTRKKSKAKQRKKREGTSVVKRRTRQEDVEVICEWLKQVDMAELRDAVTVHVDSEHHVGFFDDRKQAWEQIRTNIVGLDLLLTSLLTEFVQIYKSHSKGKDKYMSLLLDWYKCTEQYVVSSKGDVAWCFLVTGLIATEQSESVRPFLFPSLMIGCFHALLRRVECKVNELCVPTPTFLPSESGYKAEDDTSLYRLSGFALFSCIQFRQHKLMWKGKLGVSQSMAESYRAELSVLRQLVDSQKSDLPPAITIQDCGHMTFANPVLIPFVKNAVADIRKFLNYQQYSKHGKDFFQV